MALTKKVLTGMPNGGFRTNGDVKIKTVKGILTVDVPRKIPSDLTYRGGRSMNPSNTNIKVNRPKGT